MGGYTPDADTVTDHTAQYAPGGAIGQIATAFFGEPDPEVVAENRAARRRAARRDRAQTIQQTAIAWGIVALMVEILIIVGVVGWRLADAGVVDVTDTDQAIVPDVVQPAPTPAPPSPAGQALERATQAVIDNPGVAGRDEFLSLAAQARMLHLSGAAPAAVREDPYIAFHVAMAGRDLGLSPSAALNLIDVISTSRGPQLSLSPQLRLAQVRRQGLGNIRPRYRGVDRCDADVTGPDGELLGESSFSWEDARLAGLVGPDCMPGAHKTVTKSRANGSTYQTCGCNTGYVNYPQRMLWWRCVGYGCDDFFPEASVGLYSPEELGATVDEQGELIDPSTAELPPGYVDPKQQQRERQAERDAPASPDELWDLQERIAALPEAIQSAMRKEWTGPQSRLRGVPARMVPARLLRTARSMVNARWGEATKAGIDMEQELAAVRSAEGAIVVGLLAAAFFAPVAPQDDAQPEPAPEVQPDPPQDDTAPQGAADDQPVGDAQGDAITPDEVTGPAVDWRPVLRALAAEVQQLCTDVPPAVVERIVADVTPLHHTKVNSEIADAGQADAYPPDAPIDLRRMAVSAIRLRAIIASGVTPGGDA